MDLVEIRKQAYAVAWRGRRIEQLFQGGVAQFARKWPTEPCISYPLDIVADCATAYAAAQPDLTVAAVQFVFEA